MRASDFDYVLPEELIAQHPPRERSGSRLLDLSGPAPRDRHMTDFPACVGAGDLLVFNDTRVIPARLFGRKATGGRVEMLVERVLGETRFQAQLRASKAPGPGTQILIDGADDAYLTVAGRSDDLFLLDYRGEGDVMRLLERAGRIPLPPYIRHAPEEADAQRYQTVFASAPGAVAAPTAGLHFDDALLSSIDARGALRATLTLHVGAGTFQPLRVDDVSEHRMHAERYVVSEALVERIVETRRGGGRIIAIGTTVARALESAALAAGADLPRAGAAETTLFITPGYRFRVVDALLTNFHLPRSTLLMMVSAFGGRDAVLAAYRHAVAAGYRFFSYGDAMFLQRRA